MTSLLTVGPWRLRSPVSNNTIYHTHDSDFVVKIIPAPCQATDEEIVPELEVLLAVFNNRSRIRHATEFPQRIADFCGTAPGYAWVAMRRYDGCVSLTAGTSVCQEFCRRNWRRLGQQVLAFLEDFHTVCRRVHMDIKAANILVSQEHLEFVVSDFGLSSFPDTRHLSDYTNDYLWYYLEFGAELDQPLIAWKTDLVALGFLLARLTWNSDMNETFIVQTRLARSEGSLTSQSPVSIVNLRNTEMQRGVCARLREYFDVLGELEWTAAEPPPRSFYQRLSNTLIAS